MREERGLALHRPPRDRRESSRSLSQHHPQVPVLDTMRAVGDLNARRPEDGPGIAEPKRCEQSQPLAQPTVDRRQRQWGINPQPRPQIIGREDLVGHRREPGPKLAHSRGLHGQAGRHPVSAEPQEQIRAPLQGAQHVESRDAPARAVCEVAVHRQDDGRTVVAFDQLRRDDADDAPVPALPTHDQHVVRADVGVGVDDPPGLLECFLLLGLPALVLDVQLSRQFPRLGQL